MSLVHTVFLKASSVWVWLLFSYIHYIFKLERHDSISLNFLPAWLISQSSALSFFFLTLEQASAGAVVLTDIVFWGLLVPFSSDKQFKVNLVGTMYYSDVYEINELQNVFIPILLWKFHKLKFSLFDHDDFVFNICCVTSLGR